VTSKKASLLRTADVPPLDVDGIRAIGVGTVAWIVALVALLPFQDRLEETGNTWWLWTCVAGIGLGVIGELYCLLRRRRIRSHDRKRSDGSGHVVETHGVEHRAQ